MITIKGTLSHITFQNPDTHYTVFRLRIPKLVEPITVVGHLAGVTQGEQLELQGTWTSHPKFGEQFKASTYKVTLPATTAGIRKYLGSGLIQGISTHLADKIVDTFGDQTLEIIENDPDQLLNVHGIGQSKKAQIERAWNAHHTSRRVMQYLQDSAIGVTHAGTLLKTYGNEALAVLQTDPFRIVRDIPDIGFQAVDQLAGDAGLDREDSNRLAACVLYCLMRMTRDGHVYADKAGLIQSCADMARVDGALFNPVLEDLADQEEVVLDGEMIYLKALYAAEAGIARRVGALLSMPPRPCHMDKDQIAQEVLSAMAVRLSDEQMDVVTQVLKQKISIITGGPGTGKTTLVRALCAIFRRLKLKVVLSAPTGRAARRLSEVTGKTASTLHKLLGFDHESGVFSRNFANPLDLDLFVVDESSMVDTQLMYHLLEAMPPTAALILVGDTFQLPSVGPGNVLSDMMASQTVAVFSLTKIFRQAQESPIVMHAHAIRNGIMPDVKGAGPEKTSEFYFIENRDPIKVVNTITELCARRIPKAFPHIEEVQVLTPMHRGEAGTINLNQCLQAALNDRPGGIESHGQIFKPGDKVMHLKNNYDKEVFNGDIGRVISSDNSKGTVWVDYEGRHVAYELLELDELTLAYTISVHKSQGSEYDAVVIALTTAHFPLLQRNLLYTAMTRGRHLVIIVGSSRAFEMAFENDKTTLRRSALKRRMTVISQHNFS
ncbi:MAG: ATP-dependent RecD-like DNA helicase [Desulfobacterales bacterium]|nr:MAG: ATP-dependent RecD-like DNA helicase [Desulfobacterales bacterium]